VKLRDLHPWDLSPRDAIALQATLAPSVIGNGRVTDVGLVGAADIAFVDRSARGRPRLARAAAVILSYPELEPVEQSVIEVPIAFPYVPGLLSFREVPALAKAFEALRRAPDLLLVDGHGYAHPRRFGIACHLGLLLDVPAIGVGKSRLCGEHGEPQRHRGSTTALTDGSEVIGRVVRTRDGVKPVYVSIGHRIGLDGATDWVLRLCRGYRLPEPIRLADRLSKGR
jgi:deoxyribonuclease V